MNYSELKYIYQPAQNTAQNTVLLLHGTGGDENDLLPIAKYFGDNFNILSLRGNVSEGGMPRFFRRLGMGIFDEKDLAFRTDEMVHFIRDLAVKENFDADKIIALGYSNGANIAGSTLLQYPDFLAGAILFRPMQPFKEISATAVNTKKTPIFMSNGASDPTIDPVATVRYVEVLKKAGFDVADYNLQTSHGLTQKDIELSVEWFKKHFV
ncbi:alpha/beta hydrolase [Chitinophagaceae bacterium 26-R-25]|nr:alpha/beta hydrolase [Chitinophagaceae bacterium 26-R-25]